MIELHNRLNRESSPYLQSHRKQQVAWQVWSPEVLDLARIQKKPIFLSIGYASCHWCHSMSQQCFEDEAIAELMNLSFVNIKVDREERPDLDHVYQLAHQMLNGRPGGWPLNVFLCPDTRMPFFAGTYYPRSTEGATLGFRDLLPRILNYYHFKKADFDALISQVSLSFEHLSQVSLPNEPECHHSFWDEALKRVMEQRDEEQGGFGAAPKFPMPVNLGFLLQSQLRHHSSEEENYHLHFTLKNMAERGINDRMGGGFFRYSRDAAWSIPSFEKMLYDNAMMMDVYATAWQVNGNPLYKSALLGIQRWMRQFLLSEYGAFFSGLAADSDNQEGGFYLMSPDAISACLSAEEYELFELMFGLQQEPQLSGGLHLSQRMDLSAAARKLMLTRDNALAIYRRGRIKLENARAQKSWPNVDHKVLTGWNALAIKGLVSLARATGDTKALNMARQAAAFIRKNLWLNQGLFGSWQRGQPKGHAFLDDYVYLMDALIDLLQEQWNDDDFQFLSMLAESVLSQFEDEEHGGFYYTSHDHEALIFRSKPYVDNILPAANAVAAKVFLRLSVLAAEPRYHDVAKRTLLAGYTSMQQVPDNHLALVQAWEEYLKPLPQVYLVDDGSMDAWQADIRSHFLGRVLCFRIPYWSEAQPPELLSMEQGDAVLCYGEQNMVKLKSRIGLVSELSKLVGSPDD